MTLQYFLSIFKLSFHFLDGASWRANILNFDEFQFFSLLSRVLLMSYLRHHRLTQGHEEIFMLSSESFII